MSQKTFPKKRRNDERNESTDDRKSAKKSNENSIEQTQNVPTEKLIAKCVPKELLQYLEVVFLQKKIPTNLLRTWLHR
jgi:hypothetical protein